MENGGSRGLENCIQPKVQVEGRWAEFILRKVYRPTFHYGEWRIKRFRELYTAPDFVAEIQAERSGGQSLRKEDRTMTKAILENNP
ncbi:hypothetical protein J6590_001687 [Homalodisca vitripennis]|nr:hypothetical protein J6590_001687 [Homalodisca vitripennis]